MNSYLQRQWQDARRVVGLFGGLFSGILALLVAFTSPLIFGVSFFPTAEFPYGGILNLLNAVVWILCILSVTFASRPLVTFTFLSHIVALLVNLISVIILLVFAYNTFTTSSTVALQLGFLIIPIAVQTALMTYVTASLWLLVKYY